MLTATVTLASLVSAGCSHKGEPSPARGSGSGSAAQVGSGAPRLPRELTAEIPEGDYKTSDPLFAPDTNGACSSAVVEKVSSLEDNVWPDALTHVQRFSIDRNATSCGDFDSCVAQGGCLKPSKDGQLECLDGTVRTTLQAAQQFCEWRGMRLPTLTQWQVSFRGHNARLDAECAGEGVRGLGCKFESDFGVVGYFDSATTSEFTRTLGCWPPDAPGSAQSTTPQPITVSGWKKALYGFGPLVADDFIARFRCVRDQAVVIP